MERVQLGQSSLRSDIGIRPLTRDSTESENHGDIYTRRRAWPIKADPQVVSVEVLLLLIPDVGSQRVEPPEAFIAREHLLRLNDNKCRA